MASFKLFLIGAPCPLKVNLPVHGMEDLHDLASRVRFLHGHMVEPDEDGVCAGVLIPTCRIQLAVEDGG